MRTTARRIGSIIGAAVFACGMTATAASATVPYDDPVETDFVTIDPHHQYDGPGECGDDWESWGFWFTHAETDGVSWTQFEEWVEYDEDDEDEEVSMDLR
ncbi:MULTISPECIES: hypothetical protein [Actinokineospora]|uniref:Uncharacterized protein n=1 Tax=Actinokineospora fastidiosa TaxID=1816 RepID=A0A918GIZ1_9PSEU|nr:MULTISPECIES: hypothetical protein [Actinokineospora]UVS77786.1 hypothetical protein Actkin_01507 [Actinokineospora sp. UTMC 2448]GGS41009.1 hypothetical protein GCM10010171_39500 [Actinokineospora fastidiosa]